MGPALCRAQSSSFECRSNGFFFLDDFSKEALLTCKEMSNELQMRFSSDQCDFLCSWPDCALLSNEVGRMKRGLCLCIGLLTR